MKGEATTAAPPSRGGSEATKAADSAMVVLRLASRFRVPATLDWEDARALGMELEGLHRRNAELLAALKKMVAIDRPHFSADEMLAMEAALAALAKATAPVDEIEEQGRAHGAHAPNPGPPQ